MLKLIKPNLQYKDGFLEGVHDLVKNDMYLSVSDEELEKKAFLSTSNDVIFWLVDNEKWLGMITIRRTPTTHPDFPQELSSHISYDIKPNEQGKGYGKEILRLGLEEAKKMGFKEIFVACNEDNFRSRRVIESNGGELINDIYVPMIEKNIRKYIFKLN